MTNEILLQNIETMRKEHGFNKVGDFETQKINVSTGYFSRLTKMPENFPPMDVMLKLSETFGVSIDVLVKTDIRAMGKNSRLIQKYIEKLKDKTIQGDMKWEEIHTINALSKIEINRKKKCPYKIYINHNPVAARYGDEQRVYVQPLIFEGKYEEGHNVQRMEYQIYIAKGKGLNENRTVICYSDLVIDIIRDSIYELVQFIGRNLIDTQMDEKAIEAVQDFLKM